MTLNNALVCTPHYGKRNFNQTSYSIHFSQLGSLSSMSSGTSAKKIKCQVENWCIECFDFWGLWQQIVLKTSIIISFLCGAEIYNIWRILKKIDFVPLLLVPTFSHKKCIINEQWNNHSIVLRLPNFMILMLTLFFIWSRFQAKQSSKKLPVAMRFKNKYCVHQQTVARLVVHGKISFKWTTSYYSYEHS